MDVQIAQALIAAGPATLVGLGALYHARGANRAVNQSDGPKLKEQVTAISETVDAIEDKLTRHLASHQSDRELAWALAAFMSSAGPPTSGKEETNGDS